MSLDVNNGASGRDLVVSYSLQDKSVADDDLDWIELDSVTRAGATSIYASTAVLRVSAYGNESSPFLGQVYR